jgi:Nitrate/TMAO reductases, membrane-bound tetraheme cytochrome c subunit
MASNRSLLKRLFTIRILGATLGGAAVLFIGGIVFWGAFNTGMEATNTMDFCISCHEMRDNVYQEYKKTIHFANRSGVRAGCPDCHVPRDWTHKMIRKIQASNELYHKVLGTVSTPEKFNAHRLEMARREWARMKASDSRECRNCHAFDQMDPEKQKQRARKQHENAQEDGMTCIDCHKGIAHKPVHQGLEDEE